MSKASKSAAVSLDNPMYFAKSSKYTIGVEMELQTLDKATWDLAPLAPVLLENAPSLLRPRLSPEFIQSILEIQTGICLSVADVENDLMQTIAMAEELAEDNNCRLFSASLHPFARYRDQILTTSSRYERIMEVLQIIGRRFICQGFHVHVGIKDGETAIKVCNRIQAYLPLLLALSVSSPYSEGLDTGLMSYRTKLFEALPLAGSYAFIDGWTGLVDEVTELQKAGVIHTLKDLWWDARPNPGFGTVEIRICDLPIRFTDILAITGIIQALVATLAEDDKDAKPLNPYIIKANKWQAARYGFEGYFIDPDGYMGKERMVIRQAVYKLLKMIAPMSRRLGSSRYVDGARRILEKGTGSDFLRDRFDEMHDFKHVVQSLQGEFWL